MKTLQIDPEINLKQCLLWQYNNAPALRALILQKQDWYKTHQEDFWNYWYNSVFNLDTADDFGLTVWGEILDFPRQVKSVDGSLHVLTTEQYRTVLKGQMLKFNMGVTAPEVNKWLSVVFGAQGKAYCLDNLDMTAIPFVFEQSPSDEILWLLANVDFLPRPAGVGYEVRLIGQDIFGFNGSGLQTFDNGVFYKDLNSDLEIEKDTYQLTVSAPQGAQVSINGLSGNYQSMVEGTEYTYTVEQEGFFPLQGSGTLTHDTTIQVNSLRIVTDTPNASIVLNGENKNGAFFLNGTPFAYSYTVSAIGYNTQSGTGTTSENQTITVNLTAQSYTETISGIVSDGTGIKVLKNFTAPYTGNYKISLKAEGGYISKYGYYYNDNHAGAGFANGGICICIVFLNEGESVVLGKINGTGYNFPANHGGAGLYCYKGDDLIAVAGGGGMNFYPGGGYTGGFGQSRVNGAPDLTYYGYSVDGTQPSSRTDANTAYGTGSVGGKTYWYIRSIRILEFEAYGGSGYANPSYIVEQISGGYGDTLNEPLINQGNYGQGSITIEYTGQN